MKTSTLAQLGILTLTLAISTMVMAQKGPNMDRGVPLQRFAETLNLSEEQRNQMEALWEENREERDARREAQREFMQAKQAQMRERLGEILTPEQLEQWDEMRGNSQYGYRQDRRGGCNMDSFDRETRREMRQELRQEQRQNRNP
ncbi:hypothetical protein [Nitrincola iocasae]|uniref:Uncharacterized protein n=1 Tax=Nitrincola iocasae TaxID=2614693 RepID=A0A5J6LIH1_9GAMM|nr:hypothetical protein [Nitrincola iocasae]QEW08173.1 hypothetical protein F5I99_17670 [Nitrincola iocasae]